MPFGLGFGELVFSLGMLVLLVIPCWRIVSKAGYPGVLALVMFVPVVNVLALWLFAFSRWPLERSAGS